MTKYYKSNYYKYPIEVDNIGGEIIVSIKDTKGRKIIYSWYDIVNKNTESNYITKAILGGLINGLPKKVLIIGFGGGAFAKYLEDHFSGIDITGIDVDETMFQIAKNELKIKTNKLILDKEDKIINELIINEEKYDLILIDVYGVNGAIPDNYSKIEKYKDIKNLLNHNGVLSINYADYSGLNIGKYNKINHYLKTIFGKNNIYINSEKGSKGNIVGIYNLNKKYTTDEIILNYLNIIKEKNALYDPNMIKNIYLENDKIC